MSTEYCFYPCFKDGDKYAPLLFDTEREPAMVFSRSRSSIDSDFFCGFRAITQEQMSDEFCGAFDEDCEHVYYISEDDLCRYADFGLVTGYVDIETAKALMDQDYLCKEDVLSAEIVAELEDRSGYVKVCGIDNTSNGYICQHLLEILEELWMPDYMAEKGYLMRISF